MPYLEPIDLSKLFRVSYSRTNTDFGFRMHHAILVSFFTGARISQTLSLRGEDIFDANGRTVIKIHAAKRGKELLHNLHRDDDPAFDMSPLIELARTRPMVRLFAGLSRQYFNRTLRKYCIEAGIHSDFGHSHVFRHSSAMVIWNATGRPGAISHFLQHKSPATAMFYLAEHNGRLAQDAMDNVKLP